jgi:hypothetical protein
MGATRTTFSPSPLCCGLDSFIGDEGIKMQVAFATAKFLPHGSYILKVFGISANVIHATADWFCEDLQTTKS